jgi:hypothetical protein
MPILYWNGRLGERMPSVAFPPLLGKDPLAAIEILAGFS